MSRSRADYIRGVDVQIQYYNANGFPKTESNLKELKQALVDESVFDWQDFYDNRFTPDFKDDLSRYGSVAYQIWEEVENSLDNCIKTDMRARTNIRFAFHSEL